MKRSHIFAIVLIALGVVFILSTISDSSTYADFSKAKEDPEKTFHVVGRLVKDKPQTYDPSVDANLFTFYMADNAGEQMKIVYNDTKPQDFDKSEQIVAIGKVVDGEFRVAKNGILMKCPSKYNNPKDQNPQQTMKQL
jgi:cytochrome c-type biogenesis protein CcmE